MCSNFFNHKPKSKVFSEELCPEVDGSGSLTLCVEVEASVSLSFVATSLGLFVNHELRRDFSFLFEDIFTIDLLNHNSRSNDIFVLTKTKARRTMIMCDQSQANMNHIMTNNCFRFR